MSQTSERHPKFRMLGILVDRAVCMPFTKPQELLDGWLVLPKRRGSSIESEVDAAAELVVECLRSEDASREGSRAHLIFDPGGPWWSLEWSNFHDPRLMSSADRDWVLNLVQPISRRIARKIENLARREGWAWLWAQPPLAQPGVNGLDIRRPDLVLGLRNHECLLIDLKTPASLRNVEFEPDDFDRWSRRLSLLGFSAPASGWWILAAAALTGETEWIPAVATPSSLGRI